MTQSNTNAFSSTTSISTHPDASLRYLNNILIAKWSYFPVIYCLVSTVFIQLFRHGKRRRWRRIRHRNSKPFSSIWTCFWNCGNPFYRPGKTTMEISNKTVPCKSSTQVSLIVVLFYLVLFVYDLLFTESLVVQDVNTCGVLMVSESSYFAFKLNPQLNTQLLPNVLSAF